METSAPNMGESRAAPESGMDRASADRGPRQAKANPDSTSSIRHAAQAVTKAAQPANVVS
jgi:hypothetical protein